MQVPKPWYRSYLSAKAAMQQDLFGTNPTMAAVLDLWHKTFGYVEIISKISFWEDNIPAKRWVLRSDIFVVMSVIVKIVCFFFQQQSSSCGYSWHSAEARGHGACHVPECGDETHRSRQGNIDEKVCKYILIINCSFSFFHIICGIFHIFPFWAVVWNLVSHEMNVLGFIPFVRLLIKWWYHQRLVGTPQKYKVHQGGSSLAIMWVGTSPTSSCKPAMEILT